MSLPPLTEPHAVAPDAVAAYRRDGHVTLRGVLTAAELTAYAPILLRAAESRRTETRPLAERDLYGQAFLQMFNLWESDPDVASFVLAQRFGAIAAALLGCERVRLYHDQALFKEAGGGLTPWHQDAGYWPLDGTRCVTMWLPLQATDPAMGTLQFANGTNTASLGDLDISEESERFFDAQRGRLDVSEPDTFAAGDASFHGGWTLHRAGANTTGTTRSVMTVIWFADGTPVLTDPTERQRGDLARWIPGAEPGQPAVSRLNPIV